MLRECLASIAQWQLTGALETTVLHYTHHLTDPLGLSIGTVMFMELLIIWAKGHTGSAQLHTTYLMWRLAPTCMPCSHASAWN